MVASGLVARDVAIAIEDRIPLLGLGLGNLRVVQRRPALVSGVEEVLVLEESTTPDIPYRDGGIGQSIGRPRLRIFVRWPQKDPEGGQILAGMIADELRRTPPDGYYLSRVTGPFGLELTEEGHHLEWSITLDLEWHKRPRPVFYGVADEVAPVDEDGLRLLPYAPTLPARARLFGAIVAAGQRCYFACPAAFGVPVFTGGAFVLVEGAISVSHELGIEPYALYQTAAGVGAITVKVR